MKPAEQFKKQIDSLQQLTRLQRSLRLGLRIFWLGMGGIMLGWGLDAMFGWLPNPLLWLLIGLVFAMFPLVVLLRSLSPRSAWVWRLDRKLGLHEQVSTALDVTKQEHSGQVSGWLVQDVNVLLPKLRKRILQRGWYLEFDLISTLIVLLLGMILLASSLLRPYSNLLGDAPSSIAAPAMPPPFEMTQPQDEQPGAGQPENGPGAEGQQGQDQSSEGGSQDGDQPGDTPGGQTPSESQSQDPGAVGEILRELGSQLSKQAGTYDLGQALENLDLNGAAEALDDLNQQLDELSPESRENLAQALNQAAESIDQSGDQSPSQQALQEHMRQSAQNLQDQQDQAAGDALDDVAGDLRQLADEMGSSQTAGGGAGTGEGAGTSNPQPLSRLNGENGDMELPLTDPSGSALLSPGASDANGNGIADGSPLSPGQTGDDVIQSPLLPGSFLWKWRNVVSQYFQR